MQAPRVVVFSLQKSGTHLVQELIRSLGYSIIGQSRLAETDRPRLTRTDRRELATECVAGWRVWFWRATRRFIPATDRLWEDACWSWQARLGTPMGNRYDHLQVAHVSYGPFADGLLASRFASTPAGICWLLHDPDIGQIDGAFLREWSESGEPRVIFNFRDPRDVLVSFVNYLCGATGKGFGRFNEFQVFSKTLLGLPDLRSRLEYAIDDPSFPGHRAFAQGIWLLRHPDVCKVRFEDLIGSKGGGSDSRQVSAVESVLRHLGTEGSAEEHAARLYREDAFTFYRGQIGAWRDAFDEELTSRFDVAFPGIRELYGYIDNGSVEEGVRDERVA